MVPFLGKAGIIDDQKGILAADQPVGCGQKRRLQRRAVPDPVSCEVMQSTIADRPVPRIGCTLLRSPGPISPAM